MKKVTLSKFLFGITLNVILILCSCSQPEWKKRGFESEAKFYEFNKKNYFDSLDLNLPSKYAKNAIIGKYSGQFSILSIDINGIMKQEYPVTGFDPTYYLIDMQNPELWNSIYGHGLKIKTNYKYKEENDSYSFEYHTKDISYAYPVLGYVYYSDGSKTKDGDGYLAEKDLFEYFKNKGFKVK